MSLGWGDNPWGTGPWGGCPIFSPVATSGLIIAYDEPTLDTVAPPSCRRAEKFDVNDYFPDKVTGDDLNPEKGGTGDHSKMVGLFTDMLFGSANQTGILNDVASLPCILDPAEAPPRFLDALLLHLGFNLKIPMSTETKRRIIPALVDLYKKKGTDIGIEEALFLLLGIPVEILPITGAGFLGFECGEDFSRSLTDITAVSTFVQVDHPERFEIGKNLVVTDVTPSLRGLC